MPYRYTEEELALIKKRQADNLSAFQRNSGRGMPAKTLEAMQRATPDQLDEHGDPIPAHVPKAVLKKVKRASAGVMEPMESAVATSIERKAIDQHKMRAPDNRQATTMARQAKNKALGKPKQRLPVPKEEDECMWLYQWARIQRWNARPVSDVLIHVPNGAFLGHDAKTRAITMGKLKAMGVRPGCFDYLIPVPSPDHAGLWLEMKRIEGGEVSADQKDFKRLMSLLGWRCEIAKGWVAASRVIEEYLGLAPVKIS